MRESPIPDTISQTAMNISVANMPRQNFVLATSAYMCAARKDGMLCSHRSRSPAAQTAVHAEGEIPQRAHRRFERPRHDAMANVVAHARRIAKHSQRGEQRRPISSLPAEMAEREPVLSENHVADSHANVSRIGHRLRDRMKQRAVLGERDVRVLLRELRRMNAVAGERLRRAGQRITPGEAQPEVVVADVLIAAVESSHGADRVGAHHGA